MTGYRRRPKTTVSASPHASAGAGAEGSPQPSAPTSTEIRVEYTFDTPPHGPLLVVVGAAGMWIGILGTVLFFGTTR